MKLKIQVRFRFLGHDELPLNRRTSKKARNTTIVVYTKIKK
tara:strand:- start:6747 stop:6869 length:123 start_codon:yes stop_codon:yes gene_type:complete